MEGGPEPAWDDAALNVLALRLRDAHRGIVLADEARRPRLARRLRVISDLAKRDPDRALRRLEAFMSELGHVR